MYRLIYTIKGDSSHPLAHPYLKPLVFVAVLAVVVLAGAHLVQVVHSGADYTLVSLMELLIACH